MKLDLTEPEARLLAEHLARYLQHLNGELVRTDAPTMQHALAREVEKLSEIQARLAGQVTSDKGEAAA